MSRWFRHYAGMMRDEKLVAVAIRAKQPVHLVVWVWGAILESAAERDDAGLYEIDAAEVAYFLRTDEDDICAVLDALAHAGRVAESRVVKWGDRQYQSDKSAERQARYRDKRRASNSGSDDQQASGDVTPPSPDRHVTLQETDTELETETERSHPPASVPVSEARALFDQVWKAFPQNPTSNDVKAEKAFNATKATDQPLILAAALRRRQWFVEDCETRKRTEDEGLKFEPHLSTWITSGDWRKADALPLRSEVGKADPSLAVIVAGDDDFIAITKLRDGKAPVVGNSGKATVTIAELERARQQQELVH